MNLQLYKTRLKCLLRNRENMFWCYLFPIILASCFFFAFSNLRTMDSFKTIPIAYINDNLESDPLHQALSEARMSADTLMFTITLTDKENASTLMENREIKAYIVGGTNPSLYVRDSGLNETIIKSFLDRYLQMSATVETILEHNPAAIAQGLISDLMTFDHFVFEAENEKKPDVILIFFYSLLAYTCIFAANWGLEEVVNIQANLSPRGARVNITPIHKMKLFLINMLAAFTTQCGSILLLFLYMYYIIKVDFGDNLALIFITCLIGSLAGLSLGATVGIWIKQKVEVKESILSVVIMTGAFLSGMMFANMKYIVATKLPFLQYINPVNLITDSLYSLYYYDTYERFILNNVILCIMTIVFGMMSYFGLRRKTYASI